jgi:hypothetical protein
LGEGSERRQLMWEMRGFAGYLAYSVRKRITVGRSSERLM